MDGAAGDIFFLRFVVRYCEGYMHSVADDVEAGGIVPVLSGVGSVAGFGYLDLTDEGQALQCAWNDCGGVFQSKVCRVDNGGCVEF